MKNKITKSFLFSLSALIGFYLILIPFSIIYHDNGPVLSLLNNIHLITLFSIIIFLLIILLDAALSKSLKLVKLERILLLCIIGGNLIFVFILVFLYISPSSILILDPSLTFTIIGIVYVIFNGLSVAILATIKNKNIKKKK